MGHVRNYTFGDLIVRYRTMHGYGVLSPIGLRQLRAAGRERGHQDRRAPPRRSPTPASRSCTARSAHRRRLRLAPGGEQPRPEYIRWTQWIFLRLLEAGLGLPRHGAGQLVPGLPDGAGQRAGPGRRHVRALGRRGRRSATSSSGSSRSPTTPSSCSTTSTTLDWPERVVTMQRNWIGRSEGAEFDMRVCDAAGAPTGDPSFTVFTTRPDTSFGMTFCVLAPEHPLVDEITTDDRRAEVEAFVAAVRNESEIERLSGEGPLEKRGAFTGAYALQPVHRPAGADLPRRLRADDLRHRGRSWPCPARTSATGTSPTAYDLPIIRTVQPPDGWEGEAYTGDGPAINSEWLDGLGQGRRHRRRAIEWLEEQGIGERHGQLPAARLAAVTPAVLGLPDPDRLLPRPRRGARARRPAAGAGARRRRVPADGRVAAAVPRGLPAHDVPGLRRAGRARDRHHGHVRRLVVVLPALRRPVEPRTRRSQGRRSSGGCRSTSTSAASSTPSST